MTQSLDAQSVEGSSTPQEGALALVVANETLTNDRLVAVLARRHAEGVSFYVVVPVTRSRGRSTAVAHSEHLPVWPGEDVDFAVAGWRLRQALRRFRGLGFHADGDVGHADPVRAVTQALAVREISEVIVSTLPSRVSRWLAMDVPARLRRRVDVPVTHVGTLVRAAS